MNFKKILSTLMAAVIACGAGVFSVRTPIIPAITADAADEEEFIEGTYGDLTYKKYSDHVEIYDCDESATSVDIPAEIEGLPVTEIHGGAFIYCDSMTKITIPESVISIGENTFGSCSSISSIEVTENNEYYSSIDGVLFSKNKTEVIQYPCGNENTTYEIPDSVTSIGDYAFFGCSNLAEITIPDSVTSIGFDAFGGCTSLTDITIPDGVTEIGVRAFEGCKSLTSIEIPDSVTSIGGWTFCGCTSLTSIEIPDSVTEIGDLAFWECSSLTDITISESVTEISYGAFRDCTSLTSITIPNSVTSLGGWVFSGCTSLTSITIGNSVTKIGEFAFGGCTTLTDITILNPYVGFYLTITGREDEVIENMVVKGYENSTAQAYAEEQGFTFVSLGEIPESLQIIYGDIDGDKKISAVDASLVLAEYAELSSNGWGYFTEAQTRAADINEDGMTDARDASLILGYYAYLSGGGSDDGILRWVSEGMN